MARTLQSLLSLVVVAAAPLIGCPAVYPELATGLHKVSGDQKLDPPPPEELRWIRIVSAKIPGRARDGRTWDQAFGSLPDPYARLYVNGKELLRTPAQADTLEPTWPDAPRGNFAVSPDDKLRVEVWDSNPLNDRPIGVRDVGRVSQDQRSSGRIRVELEGGAEVEIAYEPARAMLGLGLWYELRTDSVYVTRLLAQSPADRAGVRAGDRVLKIGGREVSSMSEGEVRSAFNAVPAAGLPLVLVHVDGSSLSITLKEGPIYPTYAQFGRVD
jgi:hypothetical protein